MKHFLILLTGVLCLISCQEDPSFIDIPIDLGYDDAWPELYIHPENKLTPNRIELGRHLFYDRRLSKDSTLSCSSCHLQSHAFSDTVAISPGVEGRLGFRNAPSLMNLSLVSRAHKDGGVKSIDLQAMTPIEDHAEMDLSLVHLVRRLKNDSLYQILAQKAFGRDFDNYTTIFSLATFVKSLVSKDSKYDQVLAGTHTFNSEEERGFELFKSYCSTCHPPPWFAQNEFINNGTKWDYSEDLGRMRVTGDSLDMGKFRVASLRNIELTFPYMHDGGFTTLDEVLDHYGRGGQNHRNQDPRVGEISLSTKEKDALKAFLLTLTDPSIASNSAYKKL